MAEAYIIDRMITVARDHEVHFRKVCELRYDIVESLDGFETPGEEEIRP